MKYELTLAATGCLIVNAQSPADAERYGNEHVTMHTPGISWSDDSPSVTDVIEAEANAVAMVTVPADLTVTKAPLFTPQHRAAIAAALADAERYDDGDYNGGAILDAIMGMLAADDPAFDRAAFEVAAEIEDADENE